MITSGRARFELYGMTSPNVRKIAIMLEELRLDYRFRHVDVFGAGQFSDEFTRLNPNRKVPVLVDHDIAGVDGKPHVVFESAAILIYLAELTTRLLPEAEPERSVTMEWLMIQACNVGPMLGQFNHFTLRAREGNDYAFERYRREAERLFALLNARLSVVPYLAGADYSIADVATYPWAHYLERYGFAPADFPHLVDWRERVAARDGVKRAQAALQDAERADADAFKAASPDDLDRFFGRNL